MTLCVDDLPHFGNAEYRLRYEGCTETFQGATFVDGVTTGPVDARTARRLYQAFGAVLTIEPWESSTPTHPEEGQDGVGQTVADLVAALPKPETKLPKKRTTKKTTRETRRQDKY